MECTWIAGLEGFDDLVDGLESVFLRSRGLGGLDQEVALVVGKLDHDVLYRRA